MSDQGPRIGRALRETILARIDAARVPGCALAVVDRDGHEVLVCGRAQLEPPRAVREQTLFHLFSGTKVYTASALMLLVERGAIDLDAPITTYLPELQLAHPVTPRQLAAHDSGLPDTLRGFLAVHPGAQPGPSAAEALARYRLGRGRPPGRGARYRNVNFAILGELVSRVAGASYEAFVREALLEPLGARLSFRYPPDADVAVGHLPRWSPMRLVVRLLLPEAAGWLYAGAHGRLVALHDFALDTAAIGGLIGPVAEFVPLLREMLNPDDGVLSAASKRAMLTPHSSGAAGIVSRVGVGIGWKLGRAGGVEFFNHEGGGPGFCSETRLYPEAGLGCVILMNATQTVGLSELCHELCELLRTAPS